MLLFFYLFAGQDKDEGDDAAAAAMAEAQGDSSILEERDVMIRRALRVRCYLGCTSFLSTSFYLFDTPSQYNLHLIHHLNTTYQYTFSTSTHSLMTHPTFIAVTTATTAAATTTAAVATTVVATTAATSRGVVGVGAGRTTCVRRRRGSPT